MALVFDPTRIKALLFDTFGTVVDWRKGISQSTQDFFACYNIQIDCDAFADRWRSYYQPAMEVIRAGNRGFVRLDTIHRENLLLTMQDFAIAPDLFSPHEIDDLNMAWHRLDPWPDSIEGITRMKENFMVAPLSNGNIALLTNMAKRAAIPWDCVLGAEVVRDYKPNPNVYIDTAEILGLHPDQCLMVAAHNDDLLAASQVGMRTGFVLRPTEHGMNQTTDLSPEKDWDIIAEDMVDLANKLT